MSTTVTATVEQAELTLVLPGKAAGRRELRLRSDGRELASLVLEPTGGKARVTASLSGHRAELEIEETEIKGEIDGVAFGPLAADSLQQGVEEHELPAIDFTEVRALPRDELVAAMQHQIDQARLGQDWGAEDKCKDCQKNCLIGYVKCLGACPDPGTIPGALCWFQCILEADKCDKSCPC